MKALASDIARFWSRVDRSGECWLWTGSRIPQGYGRAYFQGKGRYTHRIAYFLTHGAIPEDMHVCHTCDNPPCCNPAHLWIGSSSDNMQDRERKGRSKSRDNIKKAHARLTGRTHQP